jgi:hypothetical protein
MERAIRRVCRINWRSGVSPGDWPRNAFARTIFLDHDFPTRGSRCGVVTVVRSWRSQDRPGKASGAKIERANDPQRERLVVGRYRG